MITRSKLTIGAVLAGLAISGSGLTAVAFAQNATAPAAQTQQQAKPHRQHADHIEGRIAFLHTELKITPEQQAQWDRVAAAMRSNDQDMHKAFETMRANRSTTPLNAVQRLEMRAQFGTLRTQSDQRFLEAFKPLYASLSDNQKQSADELFGQHHHHFRRG
jgi:protein CpxP